ncbi:mitochondrial 54S ribosomal protein uL3m [Dipodascopsis tothii]|uniref:mitochondrial 54S ribosomal protein uL3m n=1 Tax=Dipodascopsis tothii TaxID=44089 RepID=UPI0034CEA2DF
MSVAGCWARRALGMPAARAMTSGARGFAVARTVREAAKTSPISKSIPVLVDSVRTVLPRAERPLPVLRDSPENARLRRQFPARTGLLAYKRGMMPFFTEDGRRVACTVLHIDRVEVTHTKTAEKEGYYAVQVGIGSRPARNVTKAMTGHFARAEVAPKRQVGEFRVRDESGLLPLGQELRADHFAEGQFVDVRGISKGKGFAGVMKRHGFHGLKASHGVSVSHRSAGSTGQSQDPGRVLPGKKMAGHMGCERVTVQNSEVLKVDLESGIILVRGPVPGPNYSVVMVQDAIKRARSA